MKTFIALLIGLSIFSVVTEVQAQDIYGISYASTNTLTSADTISVEVDEWDNTYKLTPDTNLTRVIELNLLSSNGDVPGSKVTFIVTASNTGAADTLSWGSGFKYSQVTVDSLKAKTIRFQHDGSNYIPICTPVEFEP